MRNSKSGNTPKTNTVQNESSGKKLKQARLPFKLIAASISPVASKTSSTEDAVHKDREPVKNSADVKKRKLSYDTEDDTVAIGLKEDDNVSKENVEILTLAAKKKKISSLSCNDNITEVVSLLDDGSEEETKNNKDNASTSVLDKTAKKEFESKTPNSTVKDKRIGAGTPTTVSAQQEKSSSATKLQIKLPLNAGKKKRRKSSIKNVSGKNDADDEQALNSSALELSSDDIEECLTGHKPNKRKKLNDEETKTPETKRIVASSKKESETTDSDLQPATEDKIQSNDALPYTKELNEKEDKKNISNNKKSKSRSKKLDSKPKNVTEISSDHENREVFDSSNDNEEQNDEFDELEQSILSENENEADDETDNFAEKSTNISTVASGNLSKCQNVERTPKDRRSSVTATKVLTPKQMKLMDQRRKAREEKERKLQEEKMKKQQEKEEKELARKREREEKEEQKRKEREEKEDQKRREREEKERKRLAELVAKNEERKKKNEAKEEELRKKEEERKRKEQEKEEAELKKKKAAQAFEKFFVAKTPNNNQLKNDEDSSTGDGTKLLAFRPFQIKGDMQLAPITRKNLTVQAKILLDELLACKSTAENDEIERWQPLPKPQLYLSELSSGKILPGKWRRPSTESKDDVVLVEDELERVGLEIVEEIPADVREEMRAKFFKFHDNRRPPYHGTWRKKSSVVQPRKPFAQDKKIFDYEIDSDDEWEEEEPGESLEDGSDEDKDKESEDEDYEVDNEWFVPHGHLSDEEMQNEDELSLGDDNTREAQKAKLQLLQQEFAQEMKKKTEKIKPRLIGCIWADINGNQPQLCAKILWDTLEKKSMIFVDPPLIEDPEVDRQSETNSPSAVASGNSEKPTDKLKPIRLSDNMIKDLSTLLHGNNHSKAFLINEYIAYVEKTEESIKNGDFRMPLKSVIREKIDEIAEWQIVDATNFKRIEKSNVENNDKKKKKIKRRFCWVVRQEMLDKMDLSALKLQNSWQYILPPKYVKPEKPAIKDETTTTTTLSDESNKTSVENRAKNTESPSCLNETSSKRGKQNSSTTPKDKKRVAKLMPAVDKSQQISTPAKNKLISQFLQQKNEGNVKSPHTSPISTQPRSKAVTSPNIEDDDVVILD